MADKYPSMSPYTYCGNNPVRLVDEDGREIEVEANKDGTYTIVGGHCNNDKNIYIITNGERTGVLGQMLTKYSFFDEDNNVVLGTIINPNDNSGRSFLMDIKNDRPMLITYIINATGGGKYNFKNKGIDGRGKQSLSQYHLRGMPLNGIAGVGKGNVYGTARDVGNYAAGFVASAAGLDWDEARLGFDLYECLTRREFRQECMASQSAQRIGYSVGASERWQWKLYNKIQSWFDF